MTYPMKQEFDKLCTVPFLTGLFLLLLNDFFLKEAFHNWFTGKLSDFAGLFIFPLFCSVLFPAKKVGVYWLTALLFVLWKSPFSQDFIELFTQHVYPIHRVVDISDLMALSILPLSYRFAVSTGAYILNINPALIGIISIFSFCATTIPEPIQTFEQPQYILLKDNRLTFDEDGYPEDLQVYRLDSLVVVEVNRLLIDQDPVLDDDYHKTYVQQDLILRVLRTTQPGYRVSLQNFQELADSLTIEKEVSLSIEKPAYTDSLHFKGSRLHGKFYRISNEGIALLTGQYREGLEDSVWHQLNEAGELTKRMVYADGVLLRTEEQKKEGGLKVKEYKTRAEVIQAKYFHLAVLTLLAVGLVVYIVRLRNKSQPVTLLKTHMGKISYSLLMPFLILLVSEWISFFVPQSFSYPFLVIFLKFKLVFMLFIPAFLILFYLLKIRRWLELFCYIFLFSLLVVIMEESLYLKNILEQTALK